MKYCINGRFITRPITGVDRYAREIVRELDKIVPIDEVCVLLPENERPVEAPRLNNIPLISWGKKTGYAWEQLDFYSFTKKHRLLPVSLCNTAPIKNAGIVCIHDMNVRANPSYYSRRFEIAYRMLYMWETKSADRIITVSSFSKREIEKYYPVSRGKISVIHNSWQHVDRIEPDDTVFQRNGLEKDSYYFAMSSLAPNKNLKWIIESARLNPNEQFVVAGGLNTRVFGEREIPRADNVFYIGYVSDEEAKALMKGCKGFLYPTFYEGFGIPPMEALACGSPVAVSDTEVMHEIYGNSVSYIDPHAPCGDISNLFISTHNAGVLDNYSWKESAERLLHVMTEVYFSKDASQTGGW